MKYFAFIILYSIGLNCAGKVVPSLGKDTTKKLNKSSISIEGGANITYPVTSYLPNDGWGGKPIRGYGQWEALSYNYSIAHTEHYSMGVKLTIGYIQYRYVGEFPYAATYGTPILLQQLYEYELSTGLFFNVKILKGIKWYNELDIVENLRASSYNTSYSAQYQFSYLSSESYTQFLFYYTGISVPVCKQVELTPLIGFPLYDMSKLYYHMPPNLNAYNNMRIGMSITYKF